MAKGSYSVDNRPPRKDSSFKSFICSLLIFLVLCIIILLATIKWNNKASDEFQQKPEKNIKEDVEVFDDKDRNYTGRIVIITATDKVPKSTTNPLEKITLTEPIDFKTTTTPATKILGPIENKSTTEVEQITQSTEREDSTTSRTVEAMKDGSAKTRIFNTLADTETTTEEEDILLLPLTRSSRIRVSSPLEDHTTSSMSLADSTTKLSSILTSTLGSLTKSPPIAPATTEEEDILSKAFTKSFIKHFRTGVISPLENTTVIDHTTSDMTSVDSTTKPSSILISTLGSLTKSPPIAPATTEEEDLLLLPLTQSSRILVYSPIEDTTEIDHTTSSMISAVSTTKPTSTLTSTLASLTKLPPIASVTTEEEISSTTEQETTISVLSTTSSTTEEQILSTTEQATIPSVLSTTSSTTTTTTPNPQPIISTIKPKPPPIPAKSKICTTSICNQTASRMLNLIKHSTSPCEDFYDFACGGGQSYSQSHLEKPINDALQPYLIGTNSSLKYYQNLNKFYTTCMGHEAFFKYNERIKNVKLLVGDVGSFKDRSSTDQPNLTELFTKLLLRQSLPFFDFALDIDENSTFILQLTIPEHGSLKSGLKKWSNLYTHYQNCLQKEKSKIFTTYLDLDEIYASLRSCQSNYSNYIDLIEETVRQLQIFNQLNTTQSMREIKDIRFTIEFDILNQIRLFPTPFEIQQIYVDRQFQYKTVDDLKTNLPNINWTELLKNSTGYDFGPHDRIQVYFWESFVKIFQYLSAVDPRRLNNALLAIYADNLYQHTVIPKSKINRDSYCLELSKQLLPDVAFYTIQTLFDEKIGTGQRLTADLFDLLKRQFERSLFERDWLDVNSTIILKEQFNRIHADFPINFNQQIVNDNQQGLIIDDNYQDNLISLIINRKKTIWSLVTQPVSSQLIYLNFLDAMSMEPLTIQETGTIVIPFGLLYKIQPEIPSYLTNSSIGLHLARAIIRNFDKKSMYKSLSPDAIPYYNYLSIYTDEQSIYFSPRIFEQRNITFKLNGSLSTNERIIDNAAFRLVLDTFGNSSVNGRLLPWISDAYSTEKIIFISAAQEYCESSTILDFMLQIFESENLPAPLKVQNIIGNSRSFIEEFQCAEGAGMNLIDDKLQFPYLVDQEEASLSNN